MPPSPSPVILNTMDQTLLVGIIFSNKRKIDEPLVCFFIPYPRKKRIYLYRFSVLYENEFFFTLRSDTDGKHQYTFRYISDLAFTRFRAALLSDLSRRVIASIFLLIPLGLFIHPWYSNAFIDTEKSSFLPLKHRAVESNNVTATKAAIRKMSRHFFLL